MSFCVVQTKAIKTNNDKKMENRFFALECVLKIATTAKKLF